jgi:hypothetical protein
LKDHANETSDEEKKRIKEKFDDFFTICRKGLIKMLEYGREIQRKARMSQQIDEKGKVKEQSKGKEGQREVYVEQFNSLLLKMGADLEQKFKIFETSNITDEKEEEMGGDDDL